MFITVFLVFYTKKHQRKLWKRTGPLRKGLAERAVTESIRVTWSTDSWGLSPLLRAQTLIFPLKPNCQERAEADTSSFSR